MPGVDPKSKTLDTDLKAMAENGADHVAAADDGQDKVVREIDVYLTNRCLGADTQVEQGTTVRQLITGGRGRAVCCRFHPSPQLFCPP